MKLFWRKRYETDDSFFVSTALISSGKKKIESEANFFNILK